LNVLIYYKEGSVVGFFCYTCVMEMENGKWKMENGKWKMENGK
jgi:hypothetical protein